MDERILCYDGLMLDMQAHTCLLDGTALPLTPTQYEIVRVLLEHKGELVTSRDLFRQVWKTKRYSTFEKNTLSAHIVALRKRLGDNYGHPRFIATVHSKGYRLGVSTEDIGSQHTEGNHES